MEGYDVSKGFQGSRKYDRNKGELNLYDMFGTRRGCFEALIKIINDEKVFCACYLVVRKVMKN
jgi:hypothetical protein